MSDKVKLPKEVANAIQILRNIGKEQSLLLDHEYLADEELAAPIWNFIDGDNPNLERIGIYYLALVNGFEVEQTPEDKVRERYENEIDTYFRLGVRDTLDRLNIKIEGVNA